MRPFRPTLWRNIMTNLTEETTPTFIQHAAESVRAHLATSQPLSSFLEGAGTLTLEERRIIVDQALVLVPTA